MALTNLNSTHLSAAQITAVQNAINTLEESLAGVNVNLSAEDRQRYGSINEQNKLFVNRVYDYHRNQPDLRATDVDWDEYEKDFTSRQNLDGFINRLDSLLVRLKNAKILYDYDNYQSALTDYGYASYKAGTATPGFETKQTELRQFFMKSKPAGNNDDPIPPQP